MIDRAWTPAGRGPRGDRPERTTIFMVALFLILLAFFIFLNVISRVEEQRSRAVMDSLSTTFRSGPSWFAGEFGLGGDALGYDRAIRMQQTVAALFETEIGLARVETVVRGRLMEITIPADALFEADGVRPSMGPLLERLAAQLTDTPPALRYDLEFYVHGQGLPLVPDAPMPVEIARAAAFATALIGRNAPPEAVAAGVERGDPREVVLRFHVRRRDRDRVTFDSLSGG